MLREIISITGKPGLFKMIGHGNRRIIVEDLATKRRFPALERDKIISLGDIAMYTNGDDKPLGEILELVYANQKGKEIDVKAIVEGGKLREKFKEILPDFDEDRVHDSDIKKLFTWYNILLASGMSRFTKEEKEEDKAEPAETKEDDKKAQ